MKTNENSDRIYRALTSFLENYKMKGVCGFWVDEEPDDENNYWVYIVLDLNWLEKQKVDKQMVAQKFRVEVKGEIKKYFGIGVKVGSTARNCD